MVFCVRNAGRDSCDFMQYRHAFRQQTSKTRRWPGLSELFCSGQNSFLFFCHHVIPISVLNRSGSSRRPEISTAIFHSSTSALNSGYSVSASFRPSIMPGICAELYRSNCLYFILSRLLNSAPWKIKKSRKNSSIRPSVMP